MRSRVSFIKSRIGQSIASRGSLIIVRWTEFTGGTADPLTNELVNATPISKSDRIYGLIHFVSPTTNGVRVYNELAIGDAIVDLDPSFDIVDKEDLTFEFASATWVQKEVGKELAKAWDVLFNDTLLSRTLLLTRNP